ncbi:MAG: response regulator [Ponticaulis sp.]|nr:response regulator [Ponticaulis sp.]
MKVLVVEDDNTVRMLICHLLESAGFELIQADNGKHAIELAKTDLPSVVVLDCMMPAMDGIETVKRMKEIPELKNIATLMLSGRRSSENEEKAFREGVDSYMTKPFDREELIESVRKLAS